MGLPARKIETDEGVRRDRPDLRVVKPTPRKRQPASHKATQPKQGACTSAKRQPAKQAAGRSTSVRRGKANVAQQNFRLFVVVVAVVAVLGVGRVWLSVLAAEASLEANQLRRDIKNERYVGDMLEIQQSALSSPSRIRAIASAAFDMAPAEDVTYIDIRKPSQAQNASVSTAPARTRKKTGVIADVLALTAGEAQVLLVGDVGLAAAR